jgi:riboflavin kinase/FMN adenylyltransferase
LLAVSRHFALRHLPVKIFRDAAALPTTMQRGAVTIGNYDGVHRGHAALLSQLKSVSQRLGCAAIVVTFDPHPLALLRPESTPTPLSWVERKAELLGQQGVDALVVLSTTPELLRLTPAEFVDRILVEQLRARAVVEGPNFHFGYKRAGNTAVLEDLCRARQIETLVVDPVATGEEWISSTRIRELLRAGEIRKANELLTAPYRLRGQVVQGAQRGRTIGFPTLNLAGVTTLVPGHGVYAGNVYLADGQHAAAINIGPNPTFGEQTDKIEAHVLDWSGDLYGQGIELELLDRVRGVRKFSSADELIAQVKLDVSQVRNLAAKTSSLD